MDCFLYDRGLSDERVNDQYLNLYLGIKRNIIGVVTRSIYQLKEIDCL